jgi:ATP-dependent DNA helicase DinG
VQQEGAGASRVPKKHKVADSLPAKRAVPLPLPSQHRAAQPSATSKEGRATAVARQQASSRVIRDRQPATFFFTSTSGYRTGQREAIEQVDALFLKHKYVILEAPTGVGKSHIAATFAKQHRRAHIVTVQKILQDQYAASFSWMAVMKGRGEYDCLAEKGKSCSQGLCRRSKGKIKHPDCPYKSALSAAQRADVTVHNFDSFYYQNKAHAFSARELMVIDEAHNIEGKFLDFIAFALSNKSNQKLKIPNYETVQQYDVFIDEQSEQLSGRLAVLEEYEEILTGEQLKEKDELTELVEKLQRYQKNRKDRTLEYVVDYADHGMWQTVTFRPLYVGAFVRQELMPFGAHVLMMSATILDKQIFCKSIGINADEAAFVQLDSSFPVENRLVYKHYAGSMSYKNIDKTLPKMAAQLNMILDEHRDERGIIHTSSERVAEYIKRFFVSNSRLTFRKDYRTVVEMMQVHRAKTGSVIVASGLKEGLDLFDDLSRFQVICKVPYPSLADKRVKRRMQLEPSWYGFLTALMFVQSIGRSVRSETDHAETYVLDSDFDRFMAMNGKMLPPYIRRAVRSYADA